MSAPSCRRPRPDAGPGRDGRTGSPPRRHTVRRVDSSRRDAPLLSAAKVVLTLLFSSLLTLTLTSCSSPPPHWHVATSPHPGSYDNELFRVAAVSASDIWAVGEYSSLGFPLQTLAIHWNGTTWSSIPTPNQGAGDNRLLDIAAV